MWGRRAVTDLQESEYQNYGDAMAWPSRAIVLDTKKQNALDRRNKAVSGRAARIATTARTALEEAIADGTIRKGLDLRIETKDETPKKVRVESMKAIIDEDGKKQLNITARILEEDGTSIDWLTPASSTVSMEQAVADFPKAVVGPTRNETPPAESAIEPQPPTVLEAEKRLPPERGPS
jgi:hypothetical protein